MFVDPYVYPNSNVLINKLGLRDEKALRTFEYEATAVRLAELYQKPITGRFDLDHARKTHAYVFQDVYPWAGEPRTINISKGGTSFDSINIYPVRMHVLAESFERENRLHGLAKPEFIDRLALYYTGLNKAHVFREGNGRVTRELIRVMSAEAGYTLDQTRIDTRKAEWYDAAKASSNGDMSGVKSFFAESIRPTRSHAFEVLPREQALREHPELAGAFQRLAAAGDRVAAAFPNNAKAQSHYLGQARAEIIRSLDTGRVTPEALAVRQVPAPTATPYQAGKSRGDPTAPTQSANYTARPAVGRGR